MDYTELPQDIADAYVMLRLAQLIREGRVAAAVEEGLARGTGNFGATDLAALGPAIVTALDGLGAREVDWPSRADRAVKASALPSYLPESRCHPGCSHLPPRRSRVFDRALRARHPRPGYKSEARSSQ